jgi:hypothetical protein
MQIEVFMVNILVTYVLIVFLNHFQSVRVKNQNQTKIHCENGGLLQNSRCVLYPDTNHYFSVDLQAWKVNIPMILAKKQLNCEWYDFISDCTVYGCTVMVRLVNIYTSFHCALLVCSLVFTAKYQRSVFVCEILWIATRLDDIQNFTVLLEWNSLYIFK